MKTTSFTPTLTTALLGTGMKPSVAASWEYRSNRASWPACVPSGMRSGVKYRALDWVAGSTCSATLREPFSSSVFLPLVRASRAFA